MREAQDADIAGKIVGSGLLSIAQAQDFLGGISRSSLYQLMGRHELPWVAVGRRRMIPREALTEYAAERLQGVPADRPTRWIFGGE
ncbi:MAG: helix-turn-helix domain-containing protein [Myxococcota bacterium]|nr:helix-turn-helix domain-containing protein [Myxococcota bacterium]